MRKAITFAAFLLFFAGPAFPATLVVPTAFPTIQDAIDASLNGDTVLVLEGTYNEDIDFAGKQILVKSKWGYEVTYIKGTGTDAVVTFESGEGPDSILAGFTIYGGKGKPIGGLTCGGGVFINPSTTGAPSSPTLRYNLITENEANLGGGIYANSRCESFLLSNIIALNLAHTTAGSGGSGGGLYFYWECEPVLVNNIVYGNVAHYSGGGIYAFDSDLILTNDTIAGNSTNGIGGGFLNVFNFSMGNAEITNTILWNNDAQSGLDLYNGGNIDISYSDITGTIPPYVVNGGVITWGAGVITANPNFVDWAMGDLHLSFPSPCRNTGTNMAPQIYKLDFEGDIRIAFNIADMGADEFFRHLYYTGKSVPGGTVELKVVDLPGTNPVALFMSGTVLDPPLSTIFGNWWLGFATLTGPLPLGAVPGSGVIVLSGTLPLVPGPYNIYFQSLQGGPLMLTNLCIMHVD